MKDIEAIIKDEPQARLMLNAFQNILDNTPNMIFIKDKDLVYRAANIPFAKMLGKTSVDDIVGYTDFEIFENQELAQRYVDDDHRLMAAGVDKHNYAEPLADDENGQPRYASTSKYILRDAKGEIIGIAGFSRDITGDMIAAQNYDRELEYMFNLPADTYFSMLIDVVDWRIISEHRQAVNGIAVEHHEDMDSFASRANKGVVDEKGPAFAFFRSFTPRALRNVYESGKRDISMEYLRRFSSGEERFVRDEMKFITNPFDNHLCAVFIVRDINAKKIEENRIMWAAERDELTGILNRSATMRYAKQFLAGSGASDTHALFMIDIDNFKLVNDTLGHFEGDRFLTELAKEISGCFRDSDLVGRLGGDEFLVLMKYTPTKEIIAEKAEVLLSAMQSVCDKLPFGGVSGSVGISIFGSDADNLDDLYKNADDALYRAKRAGKHRFMFFS
ncbi:MAG: GGDEF domain-containing protein [Ruminococcaceae bacterium]|nr:GGDEF domain-containing protein [Oscillospiraceae bacterium]